MYDEAMELTGLGERRLRQLKQVAEDVKIGKRLPNLTIYHHEQVVKFRDNPDLKLINHYQKILKFAACGKIWLYVIMNKLLNSKIIQRNKYIRHMATSLFWRQSTKI